MRVGIDKCEYRDDGGHRCRSMQESGHSRQNETLQADDIDLVPEIKMIVMVLNKGDTRD